MIDETHVVNVTLNVNNKKIYIQYIIYSNCSLVTRNTLVNIEINPFWLQPILECN